MAILVTGGMGFIGSHFIRNWLSCHDERVVNLDKLTLAASLENLADLDDDPRHVFIKGDICDKNVLDRLFTEFQPCYVVHFAAETHVDQSIRDPQDFIRTNVNGTYQLLEASRHFLQVTLKENPEFPFRFLHVSTDEVFGALGVDEAAFTEKSRYRPRNPYSASKAASDHLVRSYFHTYDLPILMSNCSNNFGPGQSRDKLIPLIIDRCLKAESIPVYGTGDQIRDWLFVEDHCKAIRLILENGRIGESYNIGGNYEKTNLELVKQICEMLSQILPDEHPAFDKLKSKDFTQLITHVEDRPGHDFRYAIDYNKISSELDWKPSGDFQASLQKTIRWYLS